MHVLLVSIDIMKALSGRFYVLFHGSYRPETFLFKYFSRTNHIFSRAFFPLNFTYRVHVINPSCHSNDFVWDVLQRNVQYTQESAIYVVQEIKSQTSENVFIVSILLTFVVWNLSFHLSHLVLEFCPWLFFEVNWLESRRSTSLWILPLSKVHLLFH